MRTIVTFLIYFILLAGGVVSAQDSVSIGGEQWLEYDDVKILLRNEQYLGANIHTGGMGLNFRRGFHKTGYDKKMLDLEFLYMKHPKEYKTVNPYFENASGFVYGKQYSLFIFRTGYGNQKIIFDKADKDGVQVRINYLAGVDLGFAKPMYLEVVKYDQLGLTYAVTEKYNPEEHDISEILGRAPFITGINETKLYPGGYVKFGLNFEYGVADKKINAIEAGIVADIFPKEIPIMAFTDNSFYFISIYLAAYIGKRW